jgi:hypothetical protein
MAQAQERALRLRLHRINMQAAGMEIKAPPKMTSLSGYDLDPGREMSSFWAAGSKKGGQPSNLI